MEEMMMRPKMVLLAKVFAASLVATLCANSQ
jgi:hypothetical protein